MIFRRKTAFFIFSIVFVCFGLGITSREVNANACEQSFFEMQSLASAVKKSIDIFYVQALASREKKTMHVELDDISTYPTQCIASNGCFKNTLSSAADDAHWSKIAPKTYAWTPNVGKEAKIICKYVNASPVGKFECNYATQEMAGQFCDTVRGRDILLAKIDTLIHQMIVTQIYKKKEQSSMPVLLQDLDAIRVYPTICNQKTEAANCFSGLFRLMVGQKQTNDILEDLVVSQNWAKVAKNTYAWSATVGAKPQLTCKYKVGANELDCR